MMSESWYRLGVDEALAAVETSAEVGLTPAAVATRRARQGWNEIAFQRTPAWLRLLRQFNDPMVIILLITAAITGILTALGSHMLPDTLVILGVVVLNAVLGFFQEGKAEGALEALRSLMVPECQVLRGGDLLRLPSRELVPGDIVLLESGDKIPADLRFLDTRNTHVDESSLTGESVPVQKTTAPLTGDHLVPGDQKNMGFSGTYLTQGTAKGLVVATGAGTVFGRIAGLVQEAADMVLADDNFATIVNAVEEGRHAWTNLEKAILYTLPTNAAQALLIMGAILLASSVPVFAARFVLEPVQILWINLLDSVLLTLPLMMEPKEPGLLTHPPRDAQAPIIDALFLQPLLVMGLAVALPGFLIYYHFGSPAVVGGEIVDPLLLTQAQTAAFWAVLLAHFGYVISARSIHASAFTFSPVSNPWLLGGIAGSLLIRLIPTLFPAAADLFRTAEFPAHWWPAILLYFLPSFLAIEIDKLLRSRFATHRDRLA